MEVTSMAEENKKGKSNQFKENGKGNAGKLPADKSESVPKIFPSSRNPRHDKTARKS
jgi:hypothetical protein